MAKKRKLNSKNPKYLTENAVDGPKIKEKKLMCNVPSVRSLVRRLDYLTIMGRVTILSICITRTGI